ncbi:MAG TPA: fumarylacetoacetase [Acidobacteriota bacterium]|nr:fumarylacetoacetase [Acidobacteriota bacterium]
MHLSNDPKLRSFIPVDPTSHFPIQNIPYGVFRPRAGGFARVGTAIGDLVLDLALLEEEGFLKNSFRPSDTPVFGQPSLDVLMTLGRPGWLEMRDQISRLLSGANPILRDSARLREEAFHRQSNVEMLMPVDVPDYTDFYSSREHAANVGMMFRGRENALMPNWLHLPVAYHGRASSIVVSGTEIRRPCGQTKPDDVSRPIFGPSRILDFELEVGFFISRGNPRGRPISVKEAPSHIFGMVLVNDWSARDIQRWEYQPLGPFLGKNFATSISPWVVTLEALEPFRTAGPGQDPPPLPYLESGGNRSYDIRLEVWLQGQAMPQPHCITRTNYRYLYWDMFQQVAHHTINGCNLRRGDLIASGTISGPDSSSYGSLLELAWGGTKPVKFPNGETRVALLDGDRLTLTGWAQGDGYRVGFGEVSGVILPAG